MSTFPERGCGPSLQIATLAGLCRVVLLLSILPSVNLSHEGCVVHSDDSFHDSRPYFYLNERTVTH